MYPPPLLLYSWTASMALRAFHTPAVPVADLSHLFLIRAHSAGFDRIAAVIAGVSSEGLVYESGKILIGASSDLYVWAVCPLQ